MKGEKSEYSFNKDKTGVETEAVQTGKSNIFFTIMNITNNIVGSGIITIPLAVRDSGVGTGIILLIFSCLACGWTLMVIPMCAEISGAISYEIMIKKVLNRHVAHVLSFCTFFFPLTGAMAYGIAICDNMTLFFAFVAPTIEFLQFRFIVAAIPLFLIVLPLSLFNNLHFLDKFSSISILLVLFYILTILIRTASLPNQTIPMPEMWAFSKANAIKSLPVFAFAASCHHNAVSLYYSMSNPSVDRFNTAKVTTILISTSMYVIVGLCGYISFGGYPQGNIFNNYCTMDILATATRLIFSMTLILTAPMQVFGARQVISNHFLGRFKDKSIINPIITILIILVCYTIASTVRSLSIVVELGSALTAVPIVYIIPSICVLKIYGPPYYPKDIKSAFAWCILVFGTIMIIAAPFFTILDAIKGDQVSQIVKYYCPLPLFQPL